MLRSEETKTLEKVEVDLQMEKLHEIVLYNDDVNTFDWVINSLMEVCDHSPEQAEQCSIIIHYKGKCSVKSGTFKELKPICSALLNRGLSAEIY
ncbi:MAG: ATP-dependent Clp protease adaptor ClpS [Owenweeksia sp.]|nr:ATP-dependent Clp protease adaptor ClpS [Owenweeksia sp.]